MCLLMYDWNIVNCDVNNHITSIHLIDLLPGIQRHGKLGVFSDRLGSKSAMLKEKSAHCCRKDEYNTFCTLDDPQYTLLNRLYGVWQCDLFAWYFRFQNTCNTNKFVRISRWISGFYITKSCKERHWTPFYPPNTLRGREYHFPVVRMFLREFSHKQCAETSVHKTTHPAVTKMTIVNFLVKVFQHNFNKQF